LSVYETCPRQYRYHYLDRLPVPEVETVELFLGSRVHEALEALYLNVRFGRVPSLDGLLEFFERSWRENWHDRVLIQQSEVTAEDYRRLGQRQLETYYRRYAPFDSEHTLAVERRLLFPLDAERGIWFQGNVDRLSRTSDGAWEIRDYKTGRYLPTQAMLDTDRQLGLYQLGVQSLWPTADDVELIWHFLAHDLELRSRRSREALEGLRQETLDLVLTIETDPAFPTRVGAHCQRCSYQSVCPAWRHLAEITALPPEGRGESEPVRWVDRLGELKAQRKATLAELDAEIEALERRIAAYTQTEGLEAVFGNLYCARISRGERVRYPRVGDPRREELDALLRQHGRWEEVSALDVRHLPARVQSGEWPPELVDALARFESREETLAVRISKRGDPT
jgi:RecB family exonuclease